MEGKRKGYIKKKRYPGVHTFRLAPDYGKFRRPGRPVRYNTAAGKLLILNMRAAWEAETNTPVHKENTKFRLNHKQKITKTKKPLD